MSFFKLRPFAFAFTRSISVCLIGSFTLVAITDLTLGYWAPYNPFEVFFPVRFTIGLVSLIIFSILIGLKKYLYSLIPLVILIFEVWYTFIAALGPFPSWSLAAQVNWLYAVGFATNCPKSPTVLADYLLKTREGMRMITVTSSCLAGKYVNPISSTRDADVESFYFFIVGSIAFFASRLLETRKILVSLFDTAIVSSGILALFTLGIYFFQNMYWQVRVASFTVQISGADLASLTNEMVFEISALVFAVSLFAEFVLRKRFVLNLNVIQR